MQTPAAVYQPSARPVPARVPEPEYPESMLVRSVRPHGHFRWKKCDVFLSEVLWGERVGLLPEDDRWFTIYFAQLPLARFDSHKLHGTSLPETGIGDNVTAIEGAPSPSLPPHLRMAQHQNRQRCARSQISGSPRPHTFFYFPAFLGTSPPYA